MREPGQESLPVVRGLVSNWYRAGANGLYFWNLGTPFEFMTGTDLSETRGRCYACLHEVGDDVVAHPPTGVTLIVEFDDISWKDAFLIRLNGEELTDARFIAASDGLPARVQRERAAAANGSQPRGVGGAERRRST